ncbi:hypothetical protein ACFW9I_32030 [[Kitasatospora] papulosa]|uniref:hypothetical protein n=1 Tax=[Kitasatospora] papulosa TaxID=1464011 RepID=UPI003680291D
MVTVPFKGTDYAAVIAEYYAANPQQKGYLPPSSRGTASTPKQAMGRFLNNVVNGQGSMSVEEKDAMVGAGFGIWLMHSPNGARNEWALARLTPRHEGYLALVAKRMVAGAAQQHPVAAAPSPTPLPGIRQHLAAEFEYVPRQDPPEIKPRKR